jgi:two-component system sensor histidine kinase BarA
MKPNSIKTEVWRLILLPALSITVLLSATLTSLYVVKLNGFVEQRGQQLTEKTAHLMHVALRDNQPQLLENLIQTTLDEPMVRALHLYDKTADRHLHRGPQFTPTSQQSTVLPPAGTMEDTDNGQLFRFPVVDINKQNNLGWLGIELVFSSYWITIYQVLLIVLLTTAACLMLAGYLAVKLHSNIISPLGHIRQVIDRLNDGQLDARASDNFVSEFRHLAKAVNAMAGTQEQARQDMQLYIDQSMEDLRETLETIEIQNIELDIAHKEALTASRIKSEFLANTSHEIRTPLNGIIGFTNLALKTELDNNQRNYLQTIHDSSQNLMATINDILDFSKIESGKLTLDHVSMGLREVAESTVEALSFEALEKNLQVVIIVDNNIPPQLMGDPLRFGQILSNLLNNAIKFSQRGTISIEFTLQHFAENQVTLKVAVIDEGVGLSKTQQAQLFSAFSQGDTTSRRENGGTGLGLAICKGLAKRMQGEVGAENADDGGACFWFTATLGVDLHYTAPDSGHLKDQRLLVYSTNDKCYRQLASLAQSWQAHTSRIDSIYDIFPHLRAAPQSTQARHLMVIDVAPDERKLAPSLLANLAEQLSIEFSCPLIVCCSKAHLEVFSQHDTSAIEFVVKPITHDNFLQALHHSLKIETGTQQDTPPTEPGPQARVLLVDDNNANLQLTTELLRDLSVEVTQASSGEQALNELSKDSYDLIFMDIQMPGMDGIETTRYIRQRESQQQRRTPVVALTAHTLSEHKTELLMAGLDDCIRKPVSDAQLSQMLKRWTGLQPAPLPSPPGSYAPAQHSPSSSHSPVNIEQCVSLANHKKELAYDMLSMLLASLEEEQRALNSAHQAGDLTQLQALVHKLYGSSCYTGVPHLRSVAGLLDKMLTAGHSNDIDHTMRCLNNTIKQLLNWREQQDIAALFNL